ncbi:MAG: hypothetical protein KDD60_03810 [Bdellovibrionales bacterium]|nr:hypothetical protein [Bdellovibrionales bacterium]
MVSELERFQIIFYNDSTARIVGELSAQDIEQAQARILTAAGQKILEGRLRAPIVGTDVSEADRDEVVNQLLNSIASQLLAQRQLLPLEPPAINISSAASGPVSFEVTLSVYPNIKVRGLEKLCIEVKKRAVASADIDSRIQGLRELQSQRIAVSDVRGAAYGDELEITLIVQMDGERAGDDTETIKVILGREILPKNVEKELVGVRVGETKKIVVRDSELSKDVTYTVRILSLWEIQLPPASNEFVQSLELGINSMEELRALVMDEEHSLRVSEERADVAAGVWNIILDQNRFEIPKTWVESEIRKLIAEKEGVPLRQAMLMDIAGFYTLYGALAEKRLRKRILVERVAHQEKLLSADELAEIFHGDFIHNGPRITEKIEQSVNQFLIDNSDVVYI